MITPNPLTAIIRPLIDQHLNEETASQLFDELTAQAPAAPGEKTVLVISRHANGSIVCSVASIDQSRTVTRIHSQHPLLQAIRKIIQ
ncbi:MAG: hypothetical protein IJU81_02590 [Bacteroidales bacterium]|nr:hypothetical protein [Bacteroidales bacterium]